MKPTLSIAIYTPFLDTVGGGERYMLSIARVLSSANKVDILLDQHLQSLDIDQIKKRIVSLLGIDLSDISFLAAPIGKGSSGISRLNFLSKYDFLFFLTDGSIFFSSAKKNIIHFQVPFQHLERKDLKWRIKASSWNQAIYNSQFTKEQIEKFWKIKGEVIYPPIETTKFYAGVKEKIIISVGRFFKFLKSKKHEILIKSFIDLVKLEGKEDWSLYLAGGVGEGDLEYLEQLKRQAKGFKVYFFPNIDQKELIKLYAKSSIYWHAAGFEESDPEKFEHFGITTVEAMSAGCVPVVINLGGQKEIVDDGIDGYLWNTTSELIEKTNYLIENKEFGEFSRRAIKKADDFSEEKFNQKIMNLISN